MNDLSDVNGAIIEFLLISVQTIALVQTYKIIPIIHATRALASSII